ncbi:hypothetical protein R1flu_018727 [Riccia fluitans]|uniref:SMP-30/Gluconolactonase/LRE-like region domain-containing protein n=1 Tax=Riccia fluitans TaxID=41844 RepID=A0ABD1ZKK0_9MARC
MPNLRNVLLLLTVTWQNLVAASETPSCGVAMARSFLTLDNTLFGPRIEAASVSDQSSDIEQKVFFGDPNSTFNGMRFLPSLGESVRALAADPTKGQVLQIDKCAPDGKSTSQVFCKDAEMVEPNDLAVAYLAGRVYLSGQNYDADTEVGDGDLWMCQAPASFLDTAGSAIKEPVKAIRLGVFGRTNGIEVSPDEKTLYLSEAFNSNGSVVSNKIWKFEIDPATGLVSNKALFVDFQVLDGTGDVDVDGMRVDVDGNLFVTRNGAGQVLKFSSEGEVLLRINLEGIVEATNLEFGGPVGKSLIVLGKCDDGSPWSEGKGCANIWEGNPSPGHAFHVLKYITAY